MISLSSADCSLLILIPLKSQRVKQILTDCQQDEGNVLLLRIQIANLDVRLWDSVVTEDINVNQEITQMSV